MIDTGSFAFGNSEHGQFGINTSVRTNATKESLALINKILSEYASQMSEPALADTKDALLRGQALENETLGDKLQLIRQMSRYGLPDDMQSRDMANIKTMDLATSKTIITTHIKPNAMNIVVVGDAASQFERLASLGLGEPILLNK